MNSPHKNAGSKKAKRRRRSVTAQSADAPETAVAAPAQRLAMIAEAAYYRAEQRGFEPGYEVQDWLEAERDIDLALKRTLTH